MIHEFVPYYNQWLQSARKDDLLATKMKPWLFVENTEGDPMEKYAAFYGKHHE